MLRRTNFQRTFASSISLLDSKRYQQRSLKSIGTNTTSAASLDSNTSAPSSRGDGGALGSAAGSTVSSRDEAVGVVIARRSRKAAGSRSSSRLAMLQAASTTAPTSSPSHQHVVVPNDQRSTGSRNVFSASLTSSLASSRSCRRRQRQQGGGSRRSSPESPTAEAAAAAQPTSPSPVSLFRQFAESLRALLPKVLQARRSTESFAHTPSSHPLHVSRDAVGPSPVRAGGGGDPFVLQQAAALLDQIPPLFTRLVTEWMELTDEESHGGAVVVGFASPEGLNGPDGAMLESSTPCLPTEFVAAKLRWKSLTPKRLILYTARMEKLEKELDQLLEESRVSTGWTVHAQLLLAKARLLATFGCILAHVPTTTVEHPLFLTSPFARNEVRDSQSQAKLREAAALVSEVIQLYTTMGAVNSTVHLYVQHATLLNALKDSNSDDRTATSSNGVRALEELLTATQLAPTGASSQPTLFGPQRLNQGVPFLKAAAFLRRKVSLRIPMRLLERHGLAYRTGHGVSDLHMPGAPPQPSRTDADEQDDFTAVLNVTEQIASAAFLLNRGAKLYPATPPSGSGIDRTRLLLMLEGVRALVEQDPVCVAKAYAVICPLANKLEAANGKVTTTATTDDVVDAERNLVPLALQTAVFMEAARLAHYHQQDVAKAVEWYEKAAICSAARLQQTMASSPRLHEVVQAVGCHVNVLYNAALWFLTSTGDAADSAASSSSSSLPRANEALGLLDEAIALLDTLNMSQLTVRMRLNFARCLRHVNLVDKALAEALRAAELAQAYPNVVAIGENNRHVPVSLAECYGHVAHLLHHAALDFARATNFYALALKFSGSQSITDAVKELFPFAYSGNPNGHAGQGEPPLPPGCPTPRADVVSWILQSAAACLIAQSQFAAAIVLLRQRLLIGNALGDSCVSAHFQLLDCYEATGDYEATGASLGELLFAPQDAMTTEDRLQFATRFAWYHHRVSGDFKKASAWYATALSLDSMNAAMMEEYAWCLLQLPESERPPIQAIAELYDQAVRTVEVLQELKQETATTTTSSPSSASVSGESPLSPTHATTATVLQTTSAALVRADEADAPAYDKAFVLGEAAVFYHDVVKDVNKAASLYQRAIDASKHSSSHATAQVYANFAALRMYLEGNRHAATELFQTAMELDAVAPTGRTFQVQNMYTDFLIHTGRHQLALQQVVQMIELFPSMLSDLYHKLAKIEERVGNFAASPDSIRAIARAYLIALSGNRELEESDVSETALEQIIRGQRGPHSAAVPQQQQQANTAAGSTSLETLAIALDAINFCYGKLFKTTGDGALRCYRALLDRHPENISLLLQYATAAASHKKVEEAASFMEMAWKLDPFNPVTVEHYSEFLVVHDAPVGSPKRESALLAAEQLLLASHRYHNNASSHFAYGRFLMTHMGSPSRALYHLQEAVRLAPNDWDKHHMLGYYFSQQASRVGPHAPVFPDLCLAAEMSLREAERLAELSNPANTAAVKHQHGIHLWSTLRYDEAWVLLQESYSLDEHNPALVRTCCTFLHEWCSLMIASTASDDSSLFSTSPQKKKSLTQHSAGGGGGSHIGPEKIGAMKLLAEALYKKALQLDATDPLLYEQFAAFCEEVAEKQEVAREYRERARVLRDWLEKGPSS